MSESIMQLLIAIISVVITIGGGYLIKYANEKIGSEQLNKYYTIVKTIVMSIEQTNSGLTGEEKKKIAIEKMIQLTGGKLSEEEIDRLIEATVYEVKKLLANNK
ncbi:MAG: phage holin, LLH family [Paraclostridium sp.]